MDFTWRAPISIVLGCLEAQIAIVAVSMPVFWQVLEEQILQIFVQVSCQLQSSCQLTDLLPHW